MMLEKFFDHIGLADTGRHWTSLPYEDKTPQRFRGKFMIQKLGSTISYNWHDTLSGLYQYIGTLSTGNLIGKIIKVGRDSSGLCVWSWKRFRGKGEASLHIESLYIPVTLATGGGAGSVYDQNLTHFYNTKILQFPKVACLEDLGKEIE